MPASPLLRAVTLGPGAQARKKPAALGRPGVGFGLYPGAQGLDYLWTVALTRDFDRMARSQFIGSYSLRREFRTSTQEP